MFMIGIEGKNQVPWDSILFLTGTITYGGRVTDSLDQRLLLTTLRKFYTTQLTNDKYRFCTLEQYKFPKTSDKLSMEIFVDSLPLNDSPEIFGLHSNANITFQN